MTAQAFAKKKDEDKHDARHTPDPGKLTQDSGFRISHRIVLAFPFQAFRLSLSGG